MSSARATLLLLWASCLAVYADVEPHAGMLRFPDVSAEHIVFVYANDLWIVPREGGLASPLASPPGAEQMPRFNAEGTQIAFVGNYEGNRDLYTIPTAGGVAQRVTHHPESEMLCDWTADGRLLFFSGHNAGNARTKQLYLVGAEGGLPEQLPVPYGTFGAISADGNWLAYTPYTRDFRTWKRYRGGLASDIWLFELNTHASLRMTDWEGSDSTPMWHGSSVYYVSDAGPAHRLNLWVFDVPSGERRQLTFFSDYDVKFPAIHAGAMPAIVFQLGGALRLLDLASEKSREVEVRIPGDRPRLRARSVDAADFIQSWALSSTGKRAVVQARGDIWTLPAEHGVPRNLTRSPGIAERDPAWSPDGRWLAYFTDASGEYALAMRQSDGKGETRILSDSLQVFLRRPEWSPDSNQLLFNDKTGCTWLYTLESGALRLVDCDPWAEDMDMDFSHDSRWLVYGRTGEDTERSAIWLYAVQSGERQQLTSGYFNDTQPAFDRKGEYLYFSSNRAFSPSYEDLGSSFIYANTGVLMAVPLRADLASPWAPQSDEEEWEEEEAAAAEPADAEPSEPAEAVPDDGLSGTWQCSLSSEQLPEPIVFTLYLSLAEDGSVSGSMSSALTTGTLTGSWDAASQTLELSVSDPTGNVSTLSARVEAGSLEGTVSSQGMSFAVSGARSSTSVADAPESEAVEQVEIDVEGFERRALQLPVPPGRYAQLQSNDKGQLLFVRGGGRSGEPARIQVFDIRDEARQVQDVAGGAGDYRLSGDRKQMLVVRGAAASIQPAAAGGKGTAVPTANMRMLVEPRAEWRQLFVDAWRIQRDFFYDPGMHGVDWQAVREQYAALLDDCASREDVSYVIGEMIGELNVGHAYYWGGDGESQPSLSVGLLGADIVLDSGAFQISRIIEGAPWDADARGPLSQPGVNAQVGDYLLAVNGEPLDPALDPWSALQGLAGRTTSLTLSSKPRLDDEARELLVVPLASERELRYRAWVEANRALVDERTDGRVGYIHVPDTGVNGQNNLVRQFFGQSHKQALIIDERWNGGGQIPTRFIELLNRPTTNYWARRDGQDWPWPYDAHQGPKCMLINGPSGSGGDMFPWLFRRAGLGPLIGTRTWGGLVGISGNPGLIDGGYTAVPTFAFYETDGTWGIEGHGVDPDVEVVDDPALMASGQDPQLEAGIDWVLEELQKNPYLPPARPPYPDRSGMGIPQPER